MEYDQRVPVSHHYGGILGVKTPPTDLPTLGYSDNKIPQMALSGRKYAPLFLQASLPFRGCHFPSVRGRNFSIHDAAGVVEATQHRLEIHAVDSVHYIKLGIVGNE